MRAFVVLPVVVGVLCFAGCDSHRQDRIIEFNRLTKEHRQILGWSDDKVRSEQYTFEALKKKYQELQLRELREDIEKAKKRKQDETEARLESEIQSVKSIVSPDVIRDVIKTQKFKAVTSCPEKELVVKALNYIKSQAAYKALGMDNRSLKMMSGSLMKAGYDTSLAIGVAGKSPEEVKAFLEDCKSQLVREIRNP